MTPTNRKACFFIAVLSLAIGGVRFSDGSMLLAIASGSDVSDPIFANAASQYVWDSPLKVFTLRLVPDSLYAVGLFFLTLSVLPFAGMLFPRRSPTLYLTGVVILITPALKISFQNIGVGDGLVFFFIILLVAIDSKYFIFTAFLVLGLWHPQQSFFIGGSYLLSTLAYGRNHLWRRSIWALAGLGLAAALFFYYKSTLSFEYADRLQYMNNRYDDLLVRNIKVLPLAAFFVGLWEYVLYRFFPRLERPLYIVAWITILVFISLLTTDVTRVLCIISLPLLLVPLKELYHQSGGEGATLLSEVPLAYVMLNVIAPIYSWSGFDIFLWPDLIRDLNKYGVL